MTESFRPGAASTILLLQAAIAAGAADRLREYREILMLVRANGRPAASFAIRSAIGAGRLEIVRPLLVESILLGSPEGLPGLLLAQ